MKARSLVAAASIGFMFLLMLGMNADAAELKVLSAIGMQSFLEDLGPKFERATGHKVSISFATAGAAVKRAQGGEAADVVIATRQGIDGLVLQFAITVTYFLRRMPRPVPEFCEEAGEISAREGPLEGLGRVDVTVLKAAQAILDGRE